MPRNRFTSILSTLRDGVLPGALLLFFLLLPALPAAAQEDPETEPPTQTTEEATSAETLEEQRDPADEEAPGEETLGGPEGGPAEGEAREIPPRRQFEISPSDGTVKVDGFLDESLWEDALVVDLPFEWFPGDNVTPPAPTEALVAFNEDYFYVAFRVSDPDPSRIRAYLMDRDQIGLFVQDDHVGFNLDTFNDERRSFQFRVNPLGVQVDAVFSEQTATEDFSWDAIWDSAGRITADGWVVEMAVPFKQLRFPRTTGPQTWGFEAFRSYPREVRYRISSRFTDRAKDCILCQENKITGFEGMATGLNLEFTPTLTGVSSDEIDSFPNGSLETVEDELDPGAFLRWGVTPNVTVAATVNPDFSQVEADAAQLDVNTRFALFFPEKRPFFLEGAEYFQTPLEAVFTRTVAEPEFGVKLNAKEGKNLFASYLARDEINNLIFPGNQGSRRTTLEDEVDSGVVRYSREVGKYSTIGMLYTDREGSDYHNRVGGIDGFFRFTPSDTVRVQYLRSDTLYPDAVSDAFGQPFDSFDGDALSIRYDHFARNWKGFVSYQDLDEGFRADSGFIPRVDVRTAEAQYQRLTYGDRDSWYYQISYGARGLRTENHDGLLTDEEVEVFATYDGPRQSFLGVQLFDIKRFFGGETFELQQGVVQSGINAASNVRVNLNVAAGEEIDVTNVRKGDQLIITPAILMRLGRHFSAQIAYQRQALDVEGGNLFTANLAEGRFIYNFNVRTFVRAIVQYTDVDYDPSLYIPVFPDQQKNLFTQLLFSYKINPQTVAFVGYTDDRFGLNDISLTQTGRTYFLKIGYAFLF